MNTTLTCEFTAAYTFQRNTIIYPQANNEFGRTASAIIVTEFNLCGELINGTDYCRSGFTMMKNFELSQTKLFKIPVTVSKARNMLEVVYSSQNTPKVLNIKHFKLQDISETNACTYCRKKEFLFILKSKSCSRKRYFNLNKVRYFMHCTETSSIHLLNRRFFRCCDNAAQEKRANNIEL